MENAKRNMKSTQLHVVMFPFFAFGHISPFVQLSNKLSSHGVQISFFSAAGNVDRINGMLNQTPTTQIIPLTLPRVDGLPPGVESTADATPAMAELLKVALDLMQPQIKILLSKLKPHFVLFDFAQEWLPPLAKQLGIRTIFYSVFIALSTAFVTVPSRISNHTQTPTIEEMKRPPPGFPQTNVTSLRTFEARDYLYVFKIFHSGARVYDRALTGLKSCTAILAKTCNEMEAPYVEYVKEQLGKPVLLSGPGVPESNQAGKLEDKWATWLDQFPAKSVIYCSFGSETFLNDDQIKELALGLELTGLPFFLVLNFPVEINVLNELKKALPEGFLERVKGRGVIHSGWVQQQLILAHNSVGCYLFHAGFSSVIEGLVNDCQLVMLPQKGDQFLNAKLVSLDLKAGVEVKRRDEDGHFTKKDIYDACASVMFDVDKEPGKSARVSHSKWRQFLQNDAIQRKFTADLVNEMVAMAENPVI